MASTHKRKRGRDDGPSALDADIQVLNHAMTACDISQARDAFSSGGALLTTIRDSTANEQEHVDLGRSCADVCKALERGLGARRTDKLSPSVLEAIEQLTTALATIRKETIKKGKRNVGSRLFHSKGSEDMIAGWKQDLLRILHIFNTELLLDVHAILSDPRRRPSASQESTDSQRQSTQTSVPVGEFPPPAPRACFGRGELIDQVVKWAENLEPIALIGAGGIGKTSIVLTILHNDRIKERFGSNRRFIRCDKFPASGPHFLARLSEVIGAGVENLEDIAPLRPLLSSKEMLIVLDNAESILDPHGTNHDEIYAVVDELCRFKTVCVCITSRITTVPRYCRRPQIPPLSMEAACDIFYGIYGDYGRSEIINNLLQRLDFHALSVTLLATTASDNLWDYDRLAKEWDLRRAQILRTDRNESLASTIELSLASPTFRKLGPNAHDLLGVVAFFPHGVDEKNLDWFFPTIPDRKDIFDKFCVLSLTYRSNGFVTMLAPIRDRLCPQDPESSPLLCATKHCYFTRLSVGVDPGEPGFAEARWIKSEDINVEHLLSVFTSINTNKLDALEACANFMEHLSQQKPRQTVLRSVVEDLPDNHPIKARCLARLSQLFRSLGNKGEEKRLLIHTLILERERGNLSRVAQTLRRLSNVNRVLGLPREGISQAEEAVEIHKQFGDILGEAKGLEYLAWSLLKDDQLDAAEVAALRSIDLLPEKGQELRVCKYHRLIGEIYASKGEKGKAFHHFDTALTIASPLDWHAELFWIHYTTAKLFSDEGKFDDANSRIEQAKSHAVDNAYNLGRGMEMQAWIRRRQGRLEEARSEALGTLEIYERLGAAKDAEGCRDLLQEIGKALRRQVSGESNPGEDSQDVGYGIGRTSHS